MNRNTRYLIIGLSLFAGLFLALAVVLTAPRSVRAAGTVRYAKPNGLTTGNCDSWPTACTLQRALAVAVSGDEIWVQAGVHYPGAARTDSFALKTGVALYGGFAGTESSRDARNWQVNRTILSGDIDQNDITDGGVVTSTANIVGANAYHVINNTNVISAVLDGFIITAGQANGTFPHNRGGGMYNQASHPTLRNVTFSGNSAAAYGGGMANFTSNPALTNVILDGNSAGNGAGMYNERSSLTLVNVVLSHNTAITDCGGMYNHINSNAVLTNVTFSGNVAGNRGGGMLNLNSSNPTLANVVLWGNNAPTGPEIYNATNSTPIVSYSDIRGCGGSGAWNVACGTDGGGNIEADPRFVNAANGNLRLDSTSPAIDAGNNAAVPAGVTTDLDGKPRFVDVPFVSDAGSGTPPIVDMGAYERQLVAIHYAKPNGLTTGDCDSWPTACTLQRALAVAVSGDEIWVQAGVHYPGAARTDSFALKTGVALYGGFAGTESSRDARNWQVNRTILSGDIDQNDITDGGVVTSTANIVGANAYHVISSTNVISAVLDGFIVTAGQANATALPHSAGGGMYNRTSSPTLMNMTFSGNSADIGGGMLNRNSSNPALTNVTFSGNSANAGGGMFNYTSSPTLTNVTFSGNSANAGGGMYNYTSSPTLTNVTFSGNSAEGGGGMYNFGSSPTLTDVTFSGNSATAYGGGMLNHTSSSPTLTDVTFSGNSAHTGGGMYNYTSSPTLTNVTFSGNSATAYGGGMYNLDSSNSTLANVILDGNSAGNGAGIYNERSSLTLVNVVLSHNTAITDCGGMYNHINSNAVLTNVTFSDNVAGNKGGGMYNYTSSPTLTNVTFSGNSAAAYGGGMANFTSNPTLTDVILDGNSAGNGAGMYNERSSPTLVNVVLSHNTAITDCGGMYNHINSNAVLTNVTFSDNVAGNKGGGMYNYTSSPTLTNVTFSGNSATAYGGGMYNFSSNPALANVILDGNSASNGAGMYNERSSLTLVNVVLSRNTAITDCGGMYNHINSNAVLTNVTFSGNVAGNRGGGMLNVNSSNPTLANVILWGNSAPTGPEIYNISSTPVIAYSDIRGCGGSGAWNVACGTDGGGNIEADPRFVNAANGNLRLDSTSPAIDAGNNAAVPAGVTTDLDGKPRFVDVPFVSDAGSGTPPIVDMGAYEAQYRFRVFLPLVIRNKP
ncbi:MAG TPA: choice-of-anchor Q domain-containing protein [Anaerolineae bacterium]|nr:choice-of-anchor Q domain-containing protein [Anaerolineae bacterium]